MNNIAIKVTQLSKVYSRPDSETGKKISFNALKDVNFELPKGEVLGIVGKNGSGKSTLLRILSGITKPSEGHVEITGTVASILDIGTGFHPDLSGRKNVYLRGQLLGMHKNDIDQVFDAIVDFSGVRDFIDSPVKHYSSGMFLRLAFSIIVNLKADILILDEVMAVGDTEFRRKCTQKILEIGNSDRTVIMVSHDMRNIMDMCTLTGLIQNGEMIRIDTPLKVLSNSYLAKLGGLQGADLLLAEKQINQQLEEENKEELKHPGYQILSLKTLKQSGSTKEISTFEKQEQIVIEMTYRVDDPDINIGIFITDFLSNHLIDDCAKLHKWDFTQDFVGTFAATWTIPAGLLQDGRYFIDVFVLGTEEKMLHYHDRAIQFSVTDSNKSEAINLAFRAPISVNLNMRFRPVQHQE